MVGRALVIENVAVDPARQGEGIGRLLLEFAEEAARRAGIDTVVLYTHEKMTENLALYAASATRRTNGAALKPSRGSSHACS